MERIYKTMRRTGISSLVLGCVIVAVGMTAGVIAIVNGAILLKRKSEITF